MRSERKSRCMFGKVSSGQQTVGNYSALITTAHCALPTAHWLPLRLFRIPTLSLALPPARDREHGELLLRQSSRKEFAPGPCVHVMKQLSSRQIFLLRRARSQKQPRHAQSTPLLPVPHILHILPTWAVHVLPSPRADRQCRRSVVVQSYRNNQRSAPSARLHARRESKRQNCAPARPRMTGHSFRIR